MAKTIYYTNPETKKTQSYLVHDIDADDAVRRFPDEYSFDPPKKGEVEEVKTELSALQAGENIPMGADLQQPKKPAKAKAAKAAAAEPEAAGEEAGEPEEA